MLPDKPSYPKQKETTFPHWHLCSKYSLFHSFWAQKFPKLPQCIKVKPTPPKTAGTFFSSVTDKQLSPTLLCVIKCKRCVLCSCDLSPSPGKHLHTEPTAAAASPARLPGLQRTAVIPESYYSILHKVYLLCLAGFTFSTVVSCNAANYWKLLGNCYC